MWLDTLSSKYREGLAGECKVWKEAMFMQGEMCQPTWAGEALQAEA